MVNEALGGAGRADEAGLGLVRPGEANLSRGINPKQI